jgi:predicted nucleic acid-binding protein
VKLSDVLSSVQQMFLDTAPIVYFVEKHPIYFALVSPVFERVDGDRLAAVVSPITLAECLVFPYRLGHTDSVQVFRELLTLRMRFVPIEETIASEAARLRARYNLNLPDALQCAVALNTECDTFLTNDSALKRVTELNVVVLDELR